MSKQSDSFLKDLTKLIPGYGAYLDQESRRSDDRATREFLVKRLADCKAVVDAAARQAAQQGDLEKPVQLQRVREQMDRAQRRLEAALEGYAGWFSERKVDAKLLEEIANLDANLVSVIDQIHDASKLLSGPGELDLSNVHELLDLLHQRLDRRAQILKDGS